MGNDTVSGKTAIDLAFIAYENGRQSVLSVPTTWHFSGPAGRDTRFEMTVVGQPDAKALDNIIRQLSITRDFLLEDEAAARERSEHLSPRQVEGEGSREDQLAGRTALERSGG